MPRGKNRRNLKQKITKNKPIETYNNIQFDMESPISYSMSNDMGLPYFDPFYYLESTYKSLNETPPFSNKPVMYIRKNDKICDVNCFDILQKLVSSVKLESEIEENIFFPILQNIFDEDLQKRDALDVILDVLNIFEEDCTSKLDVLEKEFLRCLLPNQLLGIITEKKNINNLVQIECGGFGVICKGKFDEANGNVSDVIVKFSINAEKKSFLKNEACIMSNLEHNNIVKILAFVKSPMMIVMEVVDIGDLKFYISRNNVSTDQLFRMVTDISTGMEYLSGKLYVHRDLAARNIFIDSKLVCKIGDFGLSCRIEEPNGVYKEQTGRLDMYLTAPEAILTQEFSIKTDVWAMGLLIWEIFYLKDHPDFYHRTIRVRQHLNSFYQCHYLPPTKSCPPWLNKYIYKNIFNMNPQERPNFTEIKEFVTTNYTQI